MDFISKQLEDSPKLDLVSCVEQLVGVSPPEGETVSERLIRLEILETMGAWFEQGVRNALQTIIPDEEDRLLVPQTLAEKHLFGDRYYHTRKIVLQTLRSVGQGGSLIWEQYLRGEYYIAEGYMVLSGVCVDLTSCLLKRDIRYGISHSVQEWYDPVMTHAVLAELSLRPSTVQESILAVRPVKSGDLFVWESHEGVCALVSPTTRIEVPSDFPVRRALRQGKTFYVESPYALSEFEFAGYMFVDMAWQTFQDFKGLEKNDVGISVLTNLRRFFCPVVPRSIVTFDGCSWEVTSVVGVDASVQLMKLFPRPTFKQIANFAGILQSTVTYSFFMSCSPPGSLRIHNNQTGHFCRQVVVSACGSKLDLDSGYRLDFSNGKLYPVPIQEVKIPVLTGVTSVEHDKEQGSWRYRVDGGVVQSPTILPHKQALDVRKQVKFAVGVKAIAVGSGKMWVFKDEAKDLDFVGGGVDSMETPMQALLREIKEELRLNLSPQMFCYLGISDSFTDRGEIDYRSHLYVTHLRNLKSKRATWVELTSKTMNGIVSWMPRYWEYVTALGGPVVLEELYESSILKRRVVSCRYLTPEIIRIYASVNSVKDYDFWGDIVNFFASNVGLRVNSGMLRQVIRAMAYNDHTFFSNAAHARRRGVYCDSHGWWVMKPCTCKKNPCSCNG